MEEITEDGPFEKEFNIGEGMDTNEPVEEPVKVPKQKKRAKKASPIAVRNKSGRISFE